MTIKHSLLALLTEESKYGYQLKTEFEAATGGATSLNIGQVYTTLQRLERDGLVTEDSVDDEERRSYRLTKLGQFAVDEVVRIADDGHQLSNATKCRSRSWWRSQAAPVTRKRSSAVNARPRPLRSKCSRGRRLAPTGWPNCNIDRQIMANEAELRWLDLAEDRISDAIRVRSSGGNS
ncbi:MAG: PadR family transcriptional regulator [Acidimicrobiales bacterium]